MLQLAKRKYPRFSKNCEVRYKVVELEDMPMRGSTVNISGGGLCFRSEENIPMGKMVALEVEIPNAPSSVTAMGKIVWKKNLDDGAFENGIEFWWLGWTGQEPETETQATDQNTQGQTETNAGSEPGRPE